MERFQVELQDFPGEQIAFVKALRVVGKVSLSDAARIYVHARNAKGTVIVAGIDMDVARRIAMTFSDAHVRVQVRPSSITTPMICRPQSIFN